MGNCNIISSFELNDMLLEAVQQFWSDKQECNDYITVRHNLDEQYSLSITVFQNKPDFFI